MKFVALLSLLVSLNAQADLVLYSDRPEAIVQIVADEFQKATGEKVVITTVDTGKMIAEINQNGKENTNVDVFFIKDIAFLAQLVDGNWFSPMQSSYLEANVPASMRSTEGLWTAVTYRVRTLVYDVSLKTDKSLFDIDQIETFADLGNPALAGTLCVRVANHTYNQTLVAELIAKYGYTQALDMVSSWMGNLATAPFSNGDRAILDAIANGECKVGLVNSYYLGQYLDQMPNFPVGIKFLNQNQGGTFVNGTAAGVSATSKNPASAQKFVEFLLTPAMQELLSYNHKDFPVNTSVTVDPVLQTWGSFTVDSLNWGEAIPKYQEAKSLMIEAGWE